MLTRLFLIVLIFVTAACGQSPQIIGIDNPSVPVGSVPGATLHKVFIATTRQDSEVIGALFSERRADELSYASVSVSVPPTHQAGALERPKDLPPDPRTEFAVVDPAIYTSSSAFVSSLNAELRTRPRDHREVLMFVHGYNMTTSDAILQVGQFVEDTGFKGVPVVFAWASAGQVTKYVYDLNSALIARPLLIQAAQTVSRSNANKYHLFAHSMGSFLTMEALVDAKQQGLFNRSGKMQNVVLASPDIDIDLFKMQMSQFGQSYDRLFILLSEDDSALRASRRVAGGVPRLGAAEVEELSEFNVIAIDLSNVSDSKSGSHSKFAGSPEIVQIIGIGLNEAPGLGGGRQTVLDQMLGELPVRVVFGRN